MQSKHRLCVGFVCVVLAGCGGGGADETTSTTPTTLPSMSTTLPMTITTTVSAEQLAKAETVGSVAIGEELFFAPMDGINHDWSCSSCHTLDGTTNGRQPSLLEISKVAGERVEGMSDVEYLVESLTDPVAFRAEEVGTDGTASMPYQYADLLSEEDVNNLVAFLLTR